MSNRGNTLLGILLVALFLSFLVFFSYRSPLKVGSLNFASSSKNVLPDFPIKARLKVVAGINSKTGSVTIDELFGDKSEILINFWATWCPPCLEELPSLDYLGRQLNSNQNKKYPMLVTISVDEDSNEVAKLFKTLEFKPSLIVLHDPEGEVSMGMGTSKFPETYLINRDGKVLRKWIGPQNWLSANLLQNLASNSSH